MKKKNVKKELVKARKFKNATPGQDRDFETLDANRMFKAYEQPDYHSRGPWQGMSDDEKAGRAAAERSTRKLTAKKAVASKMGKIRWRQNKGAVEEVEIDEGPPTPKFKPLKHKVYSAAASIPKSAMPKDPGKPAKYKVGKSGMGYGTPTNEDVEIDESWKKVKPTDRVQRLHQLSISGWLAKQMGVKGDPHKFNHRVPSIYFDDVDLVVDDKTVVKGALKGNVTMADLLKKVQAHTKKNRLRWESVGMNELTITRKGERALKKGDHKLSITSKGRKAVDMERRKKSAKAVDDYLTRSNKRLGITPDKTTTDPKTGVRKTTYKGKIKFGEKKELEVEDAPVTNTGGVANWNPVLGGRKRKVDVYFKNRRKVDGRTKDYKETVTRLQARRDASAARELEQKLNMFGVQSNPFREETIMNNKKYLQTKEGGLESAVIQSLTTEAPVNPNDARPTLSLPKKYLSSKEGSLESAVETVMIDETISGNMIRDLRALDGHQFHAKYRMSKANAQRAGGGIQKYGRRGKTPDADIDEDAVDDVHRDRHVESHDEYDYKPKKGAIAAPGSGSIAKVQKPKATDVNKSIEQQMADARKEEVETLIGQVVNKLSMEGTSVKNWTKNLPDHKTGEAKDKMAAPPGNLRPYGAAIKKNTKIPNVPVSEEEVEIDELTADQKKKREGSRKGPYQVHPDDGGKPGEKHKTDRGHPRAPDRMGSERQHHGTSPSHPDAPANTKTGEKYGDSSPIGRMPHRNKRGEKKVRGDKSRKDVSEPHRGSKSPGARGSRVGGWAHLPGPRGKLPEEDDRGVGSQAYTDYIRNLTPGEGAVKDKDSKESSSASKQASAEKKRQVTRIDDAVDPAVAQEREKQRGERTDMKKQHILDVAKIKASKVGEEVIVGLLDMGIIQVNENTETGFEVINDPVANRENLLRMAYNTGAEILDEKDSRRTVDAIRAYDRSKDASRDADWDTLHGKAKRGDIEKKYAKKERGEIDKDDPRWKHRDYHTGMHGEDVEIDEATPTSKQVKMAKGIAWDKRHRGGDMTGAWKKAEKIKKGLGDHPKVADALRKANEDVKLKGASYSGTPNTTHDPKMGQTIAIDPLEDKERVRKLPKGATTKATQKKQREYGQKVGGAPKGSTGDIPGAKPHKPNVGVTKEEVSYHDQLMAEAGKWIQKAIKKPGALHRDLGVPEDEKIPKSKLDAAAKEGGKIGQRARLAKTLSKMN